MLCTRFLNPEFIMDGFPRILVNADRSRPVIVVIDPRQVTRHDPARFESQFSPQQIAKWNDSPATALKILSLQTRSIIDLHYLTFWKLTMTIASPLQVGATAGEYWHWRGDRIYYVRSPPSILWRSRCPPVLATAPALAASPPC